MDANEQQGGGMGGMGMGMPGMGMGGMGGMGMMNPMMMVCPTLTSPSPSSLVVVEGSVRTQVPR